MSRIAIVVGSTRPGRRSRAVAEWVHERATNRVVRASRVSGPPVDVELVDLAEVGLPLLDEPLPPATGQYTQAHTRDWASTVGHYDGFVFVTPEYNHSVPAVLKNALDLVYSEWQDKPAGFVAYGGGGGSYALEHLGVVADAVGLDVVDPTVSLSLRDDFSDTDTRPVPGPGPLAALDGMIDELRDRLTTPARTLERARAAL